MDEWDTPFARMGAIIYIYIYMYNFAKIFGEFCQYCVFIKSEVISQVDATLMHGWILIHIQK